MATIAASCPICSELYKTSDDIWTTNCGHVFHIHCIQRWQTHGSAECPSCRRTTYSQGHKIYLNFEECSNENDTKVLELKSELEQSFLNASVLQQNLDASERDLLNFQKELSKCDGRIINLQKKNDYLTLQNESRVKDIELKTIEIQKLRETLNASSTEGSCVKLQQKIDILQEKLEYLSLELSKEIRNSFELRRDKENLQKMLGHANQSLKPAMEKKQNVENIQSAGTDKIDRAEKTSYEQGPKNKGCVQSVVIYNIHSSFTEINSPITYVLKLIKIMRLTLKAEDIEEASVKERKSPENVSLLVKFTTTSSRAKFLANKRHLKRHGDTKDLIILEYVGDNINSLLLQAMSLREVGYKHIYCEHNKVFVRKGDKSVAIRIDNIEDIETLKSKANCYEEIEPIFYSYPLTFGFE